MEETVREEFRVIVLAVMVLPINVENCMILADKSPVLMEETVREEFRVMVLAVMVLPINVENCMILADKSPVLMEETVREEFRVMVLAVMVLPIKVETLIVCTFNVDIKTLGVEIVRAIPAFTLIWSALNCNVLASIVIVSDGSRLGVIGIMVEIDRV
jgi:hypothetical protein